MSKRNDEQEISKILKFWFNKGYYTMNHDLWFKNGEQVENV